MVESELTVSSDPPTAGTLERWRVRHCALCELSPLPSRRFLEPNDDGLSIIIIHRALRNVLPKFCAFQVNSTFSILTLHSVLMV